MSKSIKKLSDLPADYIVYKVLQEKLQIIRLSEKLLDFIADEEFNFSTILKAMEKENKRLLKRQAKLSEQLEEVEEGIKKTRINKKLTEISEILIPESKIKIDILNLAKRKCLSEFKAIRKLQEKAKTEFRQNIGLYANINEIKVSEALSGLFDYEMNE